MQLARLTGLCAALLLAVSVAAESVRETEIMDPKLNIEEFASGDLPDDEDARSDLTVDYDDGDEFSGSGDEQGYTDMEDKLVSATSSTMDSMDNSIPDSKKDSKDEIEPAVIDNEIIVPKKSSPEGEDLSNKVSMASTANGSIFERTEVLAALIAGGAIGLLFAVFLILLLIYRMKKKDEGSYDLGKKPIYKKAPTNEFYA
ncbi:Syndecan-4 [Ophiophagus hannah]|uniref:Syndecan n=1 Tax=Ophiophagus hannah TaxID=8665 RepID=V8NGV2_OPHHA|nr:Syndecan-4 [Ophiophagus hannah]